MAWLSHISSKLSYLVSRMDLQSCLFLVVGVLVLGFICLRGFGSRTNY